VRVVGQRKIKWLYFGKIKASFLQSMFKEKPTIGTYMG
jgi:hypothetical protein